MARANGAPRHQHCLVLLPGVLDVFLTHGKLVATKQDGRAKAKQLLFVLFWVVAEFTGEKHCVVFAYFVSVIVLVLFRGGRADLNGHPGGLIEQTPVENATTRTRDGKGRHA